MAYKFYLETDTDPSMNQRIVVFVPFKVDSLGAGNVQRALQVLRQFVEGGFSPILVLGQPQSVHPEFRKLAWKVVAISKATKWWPKYRGKQLDGAVSEETAREFAEIVDRFCPQIVLVNYIFYTSLFIGLPSSILKVVDSHDFFPPPDSFRTNLLSWGGFFSHSKEHARRYIERADVVLAITERDRKSFCSLNEQTCVLVLPYELKGAPKKQEREGSVDCSHLRLGTVMSSNLPNARGLRQFIVASLKTYGENPPYDLRVVGNIRKRFLDLRLLSYFHPKFRWLKFAGPIENLDGFFSSLDAFIVPQVEGTGISIKFGEAISRRVPVISTENGSRGYTSNLLQHKFPNPEELAIGLAQMGGETLAGLVREGDRMVAESKAHSRAMFPKLKKMLRQLNSLN